MGMDETDRVERHTVLPASVAEVWAALTTSEQLSAWIGAEVELDVRPGGRGTARRPDGAVRRIRVEVVQAPRRLAFRWWPYERNGVRPGSGTRVEFQLDGRDDGSTALTVTESGWPGLLFASNPTAEVPA
jgi:uncharacterized protein YndB with AHSA1/START domain